MIIPALNEADNITACIAAARQAYGPRDVEIIVVDGGSADGTAELAAPSAQVLCSRRGRAVQMNRGARASRGQVLVFCHADSLLPAGWREAVLHGLAQPDVVGGAFRTAFVPPGHWALRLHNILPRPALWWRMDGSEAQFMWRRDFEALGGFDEIPLMEDVEMSRALAKRGRLVRIPLAVRTSNRRYVEQGVVRQWLGNMWRLSRYLLFGTTPQQIAQSYRSKREEA